MSDFWKNISCVQCLWTAFMEPKENKCNNISSFKIKSEITFFKSIGKIVKKNKKVQKCMKTVDSGKA